LKHHEYSTLRPRLLKSRWVVAAIGCITLLNACGTLSTMELDSNKGGAKEHARNYDLKAEVDSLTQPLIKSGETPGIIVGVLTPDGKMQFFGYGTSGAKTRQVPDSDTLFPVGSLSKGYLGAIAASLVKEGLLSWDDTLEKLLPSSIPLSSDAKKITLLQLATHTSGMPRQPVTVQTLGYLTQYVFTGDNFYRHFDTDFVLGYLSNFSAPNNKDFQYSNIGYGLLGYVIEQRTGKKLDALLKERIALPLGLRNTGYDLESLKDVKNRAYGHAGDQPKFVHRGDPVPDWHFTDIMKGSAALYSSAGDILIFAAAHMESRQSKLTPALVDTLQVRYQREKEAPAIAWVVDKIEGQDITYQVGVVAGYTSYLGLDIEHRTAVVVLQNSFNWNNKVGHKLLNRLAAAHFFPERPDQRAGL